MSLELSPRRQKCVVYLIHKVRTTKVAERPIYHNYPILTIYEPADLLELERIMKHARTQAELIIKRRKVGSVKRIMKFFIQRLGKGKGKRKTEFVPLFPEIGVDESGRIDYMVSPDREINPRAYHVCQQFLLKKFRETRDQKYMMRVLGFYAEDEPPKPKINLNWPKWEGKDITDLPLGYLMRPPKRERMPWEL
jgi:hypothetical protein